MSSFLIGTKSDQLVLHPNSDSCETMLSFSSSKGQLQLQSLGYDNSLFSTEYECYGILGIYRLVHGLYLCFVEQCHSIGTGAKNGTIYEIDKVNIIPIPNDDNIYIDDETNCDHKLTKMILEAYSIDKFYFSFNENLSKKLQDQGPLIRQTDLKYPEDMNEFFVYNMNVLKELQEFKSSLYDNSLVFAIHGYIAIEEGCLIDSFNFKLIIISRRTYNNIGRRYMSRGLDEEGNPANFVETEQILIRRTGEVYSYVQIRGSFPLKWTQSPTLKYNPKVDIYEDKNDILFNTHMNALKKRYTNVLCVNLVDKKGSQQRLGDAYERAILKSKDNCLSYYWFDFHNECKHMNYGNLSKLVTNTIDFFMNNSFYSYSEDGRILSQQTGVIRTNCVDSLDRTNVVQSLYARRIIFLQLGLTNILETILTDSPYGSFETIYKNIWTNNANYLSREYSGTNAQKTDFTRTGKRTKQGAIDDLKVSIQRYYKNNFVDGYMIDCFRIATGIYVPSKDSNCELIMKKEKESTIDSFLLTVICPICFLATFITYLYQPNHPICFTFYELFVSLGITAYMFVKKGISFGRKFINKPKFEVMIKKTNTK